MFKSFNFSLLTTVKTSTQVYFIICEISHFISVCMIVPVVYIHISDIGIANG